MCQVELLTLLIQMISADPNCLELSPNDNLFVVNPLIEKPFLHETGGIVNTSVFVIPEPKTIKGSNLVLADVRHIEVVETGSVIKHSTLTSPTTNDWTHSIDANGDLVITFANPIGDAGAPAWISVKGFVEARMCS